MARGVPRFLSSEEIDNIRKTLRSAAKFWIRELERIGREVGCTVHPRGERVIVECDTKEKFEKLLERIEQAPAVDQSKYQDAAERLAAHTLAVSGALSSDRVAVDWNNDVIDITACLYGEDSFGKAHVFCVKTETHIDKDAKKCTAMMKGDFYVMSDRLSAYMTMANYIGKK